MFRGGNDEVLVRLMVLREIGLHADQPEWSPQALNAHFSFILFPFQFKTTAFRPAGAPNLSLTKEDGMDASLPPGSRGKRQKK